MTTYLVRHRGVSHICRPGVFMWQEPRHNGEETERRLRLGWSARDDTSFVCHDGEEDEVTALDDDEPEPPELVRLRSELERMRSNLRNANNEVARLTTQVGILKSELVP